jgi:hypothetical protein
MAVMPDPNNMDLRGNVRPKSIGSGDHARPKRPGSESHVRSKSVGFGSQAKPNRLGSGGYGLDPCLGLAPKNKKKKALYIRAFLYFHTVFFYNFL